MTRSPAISVVLTTFNRARLVGGAIDSIRDQTFADWELIVVDDGSTDDTPAVLRAASEADSRIQIVCQRNAGLAHALNAGIARARGEFVAFQDDDDFSHPNRLRELTAAMRDNPSAQAATAMSQSFADADDKTVGRPIFDFKRTLFRRFVLREAGCFRAFFRILDDGDLRLRLEERGIDYAWIDEVLYFIRRGDEYQHLANQLQLGFYAYAMLVSAHCRRCGLPDPVVDGKSMNEVLAECNAVPDIVRDKKMTAQILRAHRARIREYRKIGDKTRACESETWADARKTLRCCGYSTAEMRAALARIRRSLLTMPIREWSRRLRGEASRRVPIAEYIRPLPADLCANK